MKNTFSAIGLKANVSNYLNTYCKYSSQNLIYTKITHHTLHREMRKLANVKVDCIKIQFEKTYFQLQLSNKILLLCFKLLNPDT